MYCSFFFFSSRRRHTRCSRDWSSDVCSSDLIARRSAAGVAAEDLLAIGRAQTGLHDDVPRPLVPHVEAVVAAEHDAIGSHQPDEEPEELRRVNDRVVVEPAQILAEGPLRRVLDLLTNRLAVLEATPEVRH